MSASLESQMSQILDAYFTDVEKASVEASKEAANETVRILKSTSPTGKSKRHYKSGWKVTRRAEGLLTAFIVHNASKPGMTQLLEFGHVVRNQKGTYGRTGGTKHISNAEQKGIKIFEDGIRERIGG